MATPRRKDMSNPPSVGRRAATVALHLSVISILVNDNDANDIAATFYDMYCSISSEEQIYYGADNTFI